MADKQKNYRDVIGKVQHRTFVQQRELAIDEENRTVPLAFASETPVERWFGREILSCAAGAVQLERLNNGGPLLSDHNSRGQVGAVVRDSASVDSDKVCRATVKFSKRQAGEDEFQDVKDEIRTCVSVGYMVHEYKIDNDTETYTATRWEPLEISIVSMPADTTVGMGRAAEDVDNPEPEKETPEKINARDAQPPPTPIEVRNMADEKKETITVSEVARATEIMDLAKVIDAPGETLAQEVARDAIAGSKTLVEFRQMVFDKRQARGEENKTPLKQAHVIELTEREKKQFSISRAILADANQRLNNGGETQCLELDISQEIEKRIQAPGYQRRGGFLVPTTVALRGTTPRVMQQRAGLDTATDTKGEELVFTEAGSFIDLLRNRAMVMQLGATVLPGLQGNIAFPKQIGAGTFTWVGENPGSDVADSNLTLDQVLMSPKTGQSTTSYSRQLLAQSVVNIDGLVMTDLAKINALGVDRAALHGGGGSAPTGVYSQSGVNSVALGGALTFAKVVDMETEIASDNADIGTMAYLTTPNVRGAGKKILVASAAGSTMIWANGEVNGYRAEATNQISKTLGGGSEHGIIFGVWAEMIIGEWGALEIITDPYTLKKQGMIEVTSFLMVDIALRYAEAFCKGTGLTAA